jgi:drug/metabolite transporter (DMT)-like permease
VNNQSKAYLYGLSAVFFWSTVASAFKIALRYNEPAPMLLLASFFSLFSLTVAAGAQNKLVLLFRTSPRIVVQAAVLGLLNPFIYYLILFKAYDLLPAQIAQPLNYTWAIVLALLSIFIQKQKLSMRDIIALVICYGGVAVISTGGGKLGDISGWGVFLALISSLAWAFYWIYNVRIELDSHLKLIINFAAGTLLIFVYCLVSRDLPNLTIRGIVSSFYTGIFEMGLTFVFWLKAMELTEKTVKIANLIFLSPFASFIIINLTLKEPIAWTSIAGLAMIVSGIIFQHARKRRLPV